MSNAQASSSSETPDTRSGLERFINEIGVAVDRFETEKHREFKKAVGKVVLKSIEENNKRVKGLKETLMVLKMNLKVLWKKLKWRRLLK